MQIRLKEEPNPLVRGMSSTCRPGGRCLSRSTVCSRRASLAVASVRRCKDISQCSDGLSSARSTIHKHPQTSTPPPPPPLNRVPTRIFRGCHAIPLTLQKLEAEAQFFGSGLVSGGCLASEISLFAAQLSQTSLQSCL
jgi:hypothetical protein